MGDMIKISPIFILLTLIFYFLKLKIIYLQCVLQKLNQIQMFYYRKRHKKHKKRTPYKKALYQECNLNRREYDDLVLKMLIKDNNKISSI